MATTQIQLIDTEGWHAVLIITQPARGKWERKEPKPQVRCIGFGTAAKRDLWLGALNAVIGGVADTLPLGE